MILSIFVIVIVGLVAYFHYVQGFFSATISAVVAVIAAVLAFSYHEPLANAVASGKFADIAPAMILVILFALIYVAIRTVTDKFVPGNLRLPVFAEKVGAGLMGLVAGLFAGGIVAIAAQEMPMGATVGWFSRYETSESRDVRLPTSGQTEDTFVYDEMKDPTIDVNRESDRHSLWVPADEIVLATVKRLSAADGSMAGRQPLAAIHPDMAEELFLQNVGIQIGAKRSAVNNAKHQNVKVAGLFTVTGGIPQFESEIETIRNRGKLPAKLEAKGSEMILVVRVTFDRQATDNDGRVRFSTGACRLVAGGQDFYPVGTLEKGTRVYNNALDDFLITDAGKGADLVYVLPKADVLEDGKKPVIADGVFVEVKKMGIVDLSGQKVATGVKPSEDVGVMRKQFVIDQAAKKQAAGGGGAIDQQQQPAQQGAAAGPLQFDSAAAEAKLPHKVGTGTADKSGSFQTASASGNLQDGKIAKLEVNGTESVQRMAAGSYGADELAAPAGQGIIKVHLIPQGDNAWAFESQVANYQVLDDKDQKHSPNGVIVSIKTSDGGDRMVASYNSTSPSTNVPHTEGRPTDVWLVYVVPAGTHATALSYNGKSAGALDATAQ